ncbi:MAG: hypothetical protein WC759_02120 [Candidatus Micrarchaeia archaeon]|jgi:hypothetical protein
MKLMLGVIFVLALLAFAFAEKGADDTGVDDSRRAMMGFSSSSSDDDSNSSDDSSSPSGSSRWNKSSDDDDNETDDDDKWDDSRCDSDEDMRERMMCRQNITMGMMRGVNASPGDFSMANVCKELNGTEQVSCMARYRTINKCPFMPTMSATEACIRNQLKISENIREHARECDNEGANASSCRANLTDKVDTLVLARFEALKERAARLQEKGANETLVIGFIADVDGKVAAYEAASTADEKKQIVREVAALWREFVKAAVQQIRAANPNIKED